MEETERLSREQSLIRFYVELLNSNDWIVRSDASRKLGEIGNTSIVPHLIKRLKDNSRDVRVSAIEALGKTASEQCLPDLLTFLKSGSSHEKGVAVIAIAKLGKSSVLPHLFLALETEDSYVRSCIVKVLGNIKTQSTISVLNKALNDSDREIKRIALWSLFKLGTDTDIDLGAITSILEEDTEDHSSKVLMLEILCVLKKKTALPVLKQQLKVCDPSLRFLIAIAIAKTGDNSTLPILLQALNEECEYERFRAIDALGDLGNKSATPLLIKLLEHEKDNVFFIISALCKLEDSLALEIIVNALESDDSILRGVAASALSKIGNTSALKKLKHVVKTEKNQTAKKAMRNAINILRESF